MSTENLHSQLRALSGGDTTKESSVGELLASQPLWVLLAEQLAESLEATVATVRVHFEQIQGQQTALVFTSEDIMKSWCTRTQRSGYAAQFYGADLSLTLPKGTKLLIDATSEHQSLLAAERVQAPAIPVMVEEAEQKRKFVPRRSSPTTFFTPPKLKLNDVEEEGPIAKRPRTFTSSNLKKVIRPPSGS